jgi:hypothetical protein
MCRSSDIKDVLFGLRHSIQKDTLVAGVPLDAAQHDLDLGQPASGLKDRVFEYSSLPWYPGCQCRRQPTGEGLSIPDRLGSFPVTTRLGPGPSFLGTNPLSLQLGDTVGDLVLLGPDGSECQLIDFRGRPLVLTPPHSPSWRQCPTEEQYRGQRHGLKRIAPCVTNWNLSNRRTQQRRDRGTQGDDADDGQAHHLGPVYR